MRGSIPLWTTYRRPRPLYYPFPFMHPILLELTPTEEKLKSVLGSSTSRDATLGYRQGPCESRPLQYWEAIYTAYRSSWDDALAEYSFPCTQVIWAERSLQASSPSLTTTGLGYGPWRFWTCPGPSQYRRPGGRFFVSKTGSGQSVCLHNACG